MDPQQQSIEIAVRIKPCSKITNQCRWNQHSISFFDDKNTFSFDYLIDPRETQADVYQKVGLKIIANVLQGYNGCIFAYGQTGSGKTFTMTGTDSCHGIIQRCLKTLWNCVKNSQFSQIKMSYFQIYNQTIKDLITERQNLLIRQNVKTGFYVQGLSQHVISEFKQFDDLIERGISLRKIKQTKMNHVSSRSHSVMEVSFEYKVRDKNRVDVLRSAKITFIDLAGSQKQKETQVQGQRLKQAASINKSLSNLSLVISKLSQVSQRKAGSTNIIHIPYRNSVLTKILKLSLCGKSKIIIICTVSAQEKYLQQTLSTLRFAQTAKSIKIKIKKNHQQYDGTRDMLFKQLQTIKKEHAEIKEELEELRTENQYLRREKAVLKDDIEAKDAVINELQIMIECLKMQAKHQIIKLQGQQHQMFMEARHNHEKYTQSMTQLINSQINYQGQYQASSANKQNVVSDYPYSFCAHDQSSQQQPVYQQLDKGYSLSVQIRRQRGFGCPQEHQTQPHQKPASFGRFLQSLGQQQPSQRYASNPYLRPSSQLSFFTENLSSHFHSPPNSNGFFTIEQVSENQQNEQTSVNLTSKLNHIIKSLQSQLKKVQIKNQFLQVENQLSDQQIKQLLKRLTYTHMAQQQIQKDYEIMAQMIRNKEFTHAQLQFLKLCIQKANKDKMLIQLFQEQKIKQKLKFNQLTQKVKKVMIQYTQINCKVGEGAEVPINNTNKIVDQLQMIKHRAQLVVMSQWHIQKGIRKQAQSQGNLRRGLNVSNSKLNNDYVDNQSLDNNNQNNCCKIKQKAFTKSQNKPSCKSFSFNQSQKKQSFSPIKFSSVQHYKQQNVDQPVNNYQGRQISYQDYSQISVKKSCTQLFQQEKVHKQITSSSQLPIFMLDTRSIVSQATNKLSNNELGYLKKEYQQILSRQKLLNEDLERMRVLSMEKDAIIQELEQNTQQKNNQIKRLDQIIQDKQSIIQYINKQNKIALNQVQSIKSIQLNSLNEYLQDLTRKNQLQSNRAKIRHNALELQSNRLRSQLKQLQQLKQTQQSNLVELKQQQRNEKLIRELKQKIQKQQQRNEKIIKELKQKVQDLESKSVQIHAYNGVLNSQNQIFMEQYTHLKSFLPNKSSFEQPQMNFFINESYYSLSCDKQSQAMRHISSHYTKLPQLPQQQCLQTIQQKKQQNMHKAAYYYYKKYYKLEGYRVQLQRKCEGYRKQFKQAKQKEIELRKQLLQSKQAIQYMKESFDEFRDYTQLLGSKLKYKQQKQFQNRQKINALSAGQKKQTSQNNMIKSANGRFFKNRRSSGSTSSLSSQDTSIRSSSLFIPTRKGISPLRQSQLLIQQIKEVSNSNQTNYLEKTSTRTSLFTRTVTNPNLVDKVSLSKESLFQNFDESSSKIQYNDFQQNKLENKLEGYDKFYRKESRKSESFMRSSIFKKAQFRTFGSKK